MALTAVITAAEEGGFVALNPETGTTTQGESIAEALENLKEATDLYLEEFPLMITTPTWVTTFKTGTLNGVLKQAEVTDEEFLEALRGK